MPRAFVAVALAAVALAATGLPDVTLAATALTAVVLLAFTGLLADFAAGLATAVPEDFLDLPLPNAKSQPEEYLLLVPTRVMVTALNSEAKSLIAKRLILNLATGYRATVRFVLSQESFISGPDGELIEKRSIALCKKQECARYTLTLPLVKNVDDEFANGITIQAKAYDMQKPTN